MSQCGISIYSVYRSRQLTKIDLQKPTDTKKLPPTLAGPKNDLRRVDPTFVRPPGRCSCPSSEKRVPPPATRKHGPRSPVAVPGHDVMMVHFSILDAAEVSWTRSLPDARSRPVWDCRTGRTADRGGGKGGINVSIYGSPMECMGIITSVPIPSNSTIGAILFRSCLMMKSGES